MKHITFFTLLTLFALSTLSCSGQQSGGTEVVMQTDLGDIRIRLYDDTPRFRDNFLQNAKEGLYDGVAFHRVIRNFMIQTGDPDTRPGYTQDSTKVGEMIEQEIVFPAHFHKRGVLAAAKEEAENNPEDKADRFQFYIVTGRTFNDDAIREQEKNIWSVRVQRLYEKKCEANGTKLDEMRKNRDSDGVSNLLEKLLDEAKDETERFEFPKELKRAYKIHGGTPWLDTEYTVFGEVVEGMKVVQEIEKVRTNDKDQPLKVVRINKVIVDE